MPGIRFAQAAVAALLALGACSAGPKAGAFRNPQAPIWSAAAFAPGQVTGSWRQVASFASAPGGCRAGAVEVTPIATGLAVKGSLCLDGKAQAIDVVARPVGPGRLSVGGTEDWWVLWVDSGYRTLAIGTPSGQFGFVLDRGAIAPDRLAAAAEIFDFNGYATGRLQPF
ncbi:MAG: lipocalin [Rhodobacterales bacterium]|nr:lipocalin [Rhodobacterales bacterium]